MQGDGHTAQEVLEGRGGERYATQPDCRRSQRGLAGVDEDVAPRTDQGHIVETHLVLRTGGSLFGFGHVVILQEAPRSVIPDRWFISRRAFRM